MKLFKLMNYVLIATLAFVLIGCGGGGGNTDKPVVEDITDTSTIVDDLDDIRDDEGNVNLEYLDNVKLTMWSVIGEPDQTVFKKMIEQFNKEYMGMIQIDVQYVGHYDYYNALDSTYANDYESFPEMCFMHNEKTLEYALKGYFYPLSSIMEATGVEFDFTQVYDSIGRTVVYENDRYGVPVDAHGFLTQFRQDIIKKNNLGFDNNTRYIPKNMAEYQELLTKTRALADSGELWVRDINKGQDHSWYQLKTGNPKLSTSVTSEAFYPEFWQSSDPDGLSALYVNGGSILDAQGNVNFHNNAGFVKYITDQVERYNSKLMGASGTHSEMFGTGACIMFPEGPWWVSQQFSFLWNNSELRTEGNGVTAEDAVDPVYNAPYVASRPTGWWTTDTTLPNADKWYGNGHVVTITRQIKSMQKAAAALEFARWYTQGQKDENNYHLTTWCASGHVPAWKNVYASSGYQAALAQNITLQALGDPADIMALESAQYATLLIDGVAKCVGNVTGELQSTNGCTVERAKQIINEVASSTQASLDLLRLEF